MSSDFQWVFDPLPPSGAVQGGSPASHVFKADLDIFIREVLQNSHDARLPDRDQPAQVRFVLQQLTGDPRERFLSAIQWDKLRDHLDATAHGTSAIARRMRQALDANHSLTVLRIEDSGTTGLTGDEDGAGNNFTALCRNTLDTSDDRAHRGGSFGLGKSVLWRFSAFSTVLFSSRLSDDGGNFRLFARSELPFHQTAEGRWNGSGWLGRVEATSTGPRAVSVWNEDAEAIARNAGLFRPAPMGTGTSIVILGFQEPAEDTPRDLRAIAEHILHSATRWFWPSMHLDPPTLQVHAEVYENSKRLFQGEATPTAEVEPFIRASSCGGEELVPRAAEPGQVAEREVTFLVPSRKAHERLPGEAEVETTLNLAVTRGETGTDNSVTTNRIALVRGAGMVVQYRRPSRAPLDESPVYGVLRAGRAIGETPGDTALERFLKAAEPPAHDEWIPTERIQAEYRSGARTRLNALWRDVGTALMDACDQRPPATAEGPAALSRLFRMGGTGGGSSSTPKFRVDRIEAELRDGSWHIRGRVSRIDPGDTSWSFTAALWLEGETGRGERLSLLGLNAAGLAVTVREGVAECVVPGALRQVQFYGLTVANGDSGRQPDLRRTRVRLEVLPRTGVSG